MGIQGLLPLVKSIMVPIHIKELEGCTVAIDTYSWLHKGALSCSKDLCKGLPTSKHIDYCMHRVNLLRHYGIRPFLVFDGGPLPMKSEQENKRGRSRKENFARAIEHESNGNTGAAYECYQKAVDISPAMAHELIQVLKQENICYVVAPYEADAQMTFLAISKQVDAVITEDSDLIAFGCPRIIYKMDKFGQGVEFQYSRLQQNKDLNFTGFTKQMILEMCILSGCDYLQSLPGLGLRKAHALVKKFKSYDKVIKHLKYSTVAVSPGYEESFKQAILTFRHQRVYDPVIDDIVHLSDLPDDIEDDLDFLGPCIPQHIAKGIAIGEIDPSTMMPFQGVNNDAESFVASCGSFELKHFKTEGKKLELPAQKNLLTNYFCFASLEAKKKYTAPRTMEDVSTPFIDSPLASLSGFKQLNNLSPSEDNVTNGAGSEVPENLELPYDGSCIEEDTLENRRSPEGPLLQKSQSIHRPCIKLLQQRVSKPNSHVYESKMRTELTDVIVRSRFFQQKSAVRSDSNKENVESLGRKDYIKCELDILRPESEYKAVTIDEINNKVKKRKTIISSSHFQNKRTAINEQNMNNRCEQDHQAEYGLSAHLCENAIPESVQAEAIGYYSIRTNVSHPIQSDLSSAPDCSDQKLSAEEGKFGSNISHLGNYSNIAEKSMEKFVAVISSFRCSSSGSRASGLRAPLKDVHDTYTDRSNTNVDFSKFAYVHTKGKALPTYRTYGRR